MSYGQYIDSVKREESCRCSVLPTAKMYVPSTRVDAAEQHRTSLAMKVAREMVPLRVNARSHRL